MTCPVVPPIGHNGALLADKAAIVPLGIGQSPRLTPEHDPREAVT